MCGIELAAVHVAVSFDIWQTATVNDLKNVLTDSEQ